MNDNLLPSTSISTKRTIEDRIYNIRGQQVMLDSDIAELFEVETKRLNEQMKRNIARFPKDFCFMLNNEEIGAYLLKEDLPYKGDTIIGNDIWIGQSVTFLLGVHVGNGTIIGANAVVASDIPPYSIAIGNPARIVKKRFDDEMIKLLEKLEWWNKTPNQIQKIIPLLSNGDISYVKEKIKHILDENENI